MHFTLFRVLLRWRKTGWDSEGGRFCSVNSSSIRAFLLRGIVNREEGGLLDRNAIAFKIKRHRNYKLESLLTRNRTPLETQSEFYSSWRARARLLRFFSARADNWRLLQALPSKPPLALTSLDQRHTASLRKSAAYFFYCFSFLNKESKRSNT